MSEEWRIALYPFGFLSALAFGARFLIQWLESEFKQKSVVRPSFWLLSILGNVLLWTHSVIQLQIHVCLVQACNSVISWRNLNLMQPRNKHIHLKIVILIIAIAILLSIGLFAWLAESSNWIRVPEISKISAKDKVGFGWHLIGIMAIALFSARFWVQWWESEKAHESRLTTLFWWTSIIGALLTIIYFSRIQDPVNLIGPVIGMIPYIRNLMLIKK